MGISDANLGLLISLAVMLIAVLSVWKDIYQNNPPKKFVRRFTRIGVVLLIVSSMFIFFNYVKDKSSERKITEAEQARKRADSLSNESQDSLKSSQRRLIASQAVFYQLQIATKDTILNRVEGSYNRSIRASNEALAKYHVKLVDSLHTVVGTLKLNSITPQLVLAPIVSHSPIFLNKKGSDTLNIQFISANTTAYHIKIKCYMISRVEQVKILNSYTVAGGEMFIPPNVTSTFSSVIDKNLLDYSIMLIVLKGSFSRDPFEKDIIPYFEALDFNFKDNQFLGKTQISSDGFNALLSIIPNQR